MGIQIGTYLNTLTHIFKNFRKAERKDIFEASGALTAPVLAW